MSVLGEVLKILNEMVKARTELFNLPNIHGIADFRRNEFIYHGKRAIKEWMKRQKYNNVRLDPDCRIKLTQKLMKAIMQLWSHPELYNYYAKIIDELYESCVYK